MLNSTNPLNLKQRTKEIFWVISASLLLLNIFFIVSEKYFYAIFIFAIPIIIACALKFHIYYKEIFIFSLFVGQYFQWSFRIQIGLFVLYAIVFFYITNFDSGFFNKFVLPKKIKYSAIVLIIAVYLSSILTPHRSFFSVYYATIFLNYVFLSYIFFRSINTVEEIDNLLYLFVRLSFFSGIIIIVQIYLTGYLRSTGIVGTFIMDFSAIALLLILYRNYLLSRLTNNTTFYTIIIFVILITTQSRFAWFSFTTTFIYGLVICSIYSSEAKTIIRKRFPVFVLAVIIGIGLLFVSGLGKVLFDRFGDVNVSFFQNGKGPVSNSIESRMLIWIVAANAFWHNPISGVGYLMFNETSSYYNILPDFLFNTFVKDLDAHTTLFNIICETGIIGLVSFVTYFAFIFGYSLKAVKIAREKEEVKISILLNLIVFFICFHSIYSGAFTFGTTALFMHMVFGLTIGNYYLLRKKYENLLSS
jgi:O-antigen ligase